MVGAFLRRGISRAFRAFIRRRAWWLGVASLLLLPSLAQADDARTPDQHFAIQPVSDGVTIALGTGFSTILGLVLGTGEVKPLEAGSVNNLLSIDRVAVTQTIDKSAGTVSDIGLYSGVGFAVLDAVWEGFTDTREAGMVDAVMYAESVSITLALDDVVKIAVRRPRPVDYLASNAHNTTNTDLALSFFSGHSRKSRSASTKASGLS
jgi:hypothetical protein